MRFLSESDVRVLRKVVRQVLSESRGESPRTQHNSNQASDVYIAKVPAAGIPALTIGSPDVPGEAECDIYRVSVTGTAGDAEMEQITGLTKTVYNLSTTRIDSRYCIVSKTKRGPWIAQDVGAAELTGTGGCIDDIDGVDLSTIPIADLTDTGTAPNQLAHFLGIDEDGCMVRIPFRRCD